MTAPEITPQQLRALLLLLVLVPFIPLVFMLRFMAAALEGEREAAFERAAGVYQQALGSAGASLEKHLAARPDAAGPEDVRRFYRGLFDREIAVVIATERGQTTAGPATPGGRLVAQASLPGVVVPPGKVQLFLVDLSAIEEAVRPQFKVYAWTALVVGLAICGITVAAGLTVSRRLRLEELKSTALATVAHELRTPLASMRMLVDTLREGRYRSPGQLREYLEMISAENLRLSRLTDHFLTHARLTRGQQIYDFQSVPPRALAEQSAAALQAKLAAPSCHFSLELAEPLPEITADRDSLITVLTNLLENAVKYSEGEPRVSLRVEGRGDAVAFRIADCGIGLSREQRRQIFAPFFQADQKLTRAREGCGLGLSIVQEIVAAHRGRIEVESEPGRGSTFTVVLPVRRA